MEETERDKVVIEDLIVQEPASGRQGIKVTAQESASLRYVS